jgi:hypothetical protein
MGSTVDMAKWVKMSDAVMKGVHENANEKVRRRVKLVLDEAVRVSPQWSGNYAVNWGVETNQTGTWRQQRTLKVDPWRNLQSWDIGASETKADHSRTALGWAKSAGDLTAIAAAKKNSNYENIASIKWNTNVRLVNRSQVAGELDAGTIKLRRVNLIEAPLGVKLYLQNRFPNLVS